MAKKVWFQLKGNFMFWFLTVTSLFLLITSFFLPPQGEIHPSVLQATAEIEAWGVLYIVLRAVNRGADITLNHGQSSVQVNNPDKKEDDG